MKTIGIDMAMSENIKALREKFDLSQEALGRIADVSSVTVSRWERGTQPRDSNLEAIIQHFRLERDDLYSQTHGLAAQMYGRVEKVAATPSVGTAPLIGRIAAGEPLEAIQHAAESVWVDPTVQTRHPDGFYLLVRGDSMDRILPDGSYAYIAPLDYAKNNTVMAVNVNGEDATIKRVFVAGDSLVLKPESTNPKHRDRLIDSNDPDAPHVRIVGEVVWYLVPFGAGKL